jgi:hypothetical protein
MILQAAGNSFLDDLEGIQALQGDLALHQREGLFCYFCLLEGVTPRETFGHIGHRALVSGRGPGTFHLELTL